MQNTWLQESQSYLDHGFEFLQILGSLLNVSVNDEVKSNNNHSRVNVEKYINDLVNSEKKVEGPIRIALWVSPEGGSLYHCLKVEHLKGLMDISLVVHKEPTFDDFEWMYYYDLEEMDVVHFVKESYMDSIEHVYCTLIYKSTHIELIYYSWDASEFQREQILKDHMRKRHRYNVKYVIYDNRVHNMILAHYRSNFMRITDENQPRYLLTLINLNFVF